MYSLRNLLQMKLRVRITHEATLSPQQTRTSTPPLPKMIMEAPHPLSFDLLTSIRSDPLLTTSTPNTILSTAPKHPTQFYMILYHRERLLAAAQDFQWQEAAIALSGPIGLLRLEKSLHEHLGSKYGNPAYPAPLKVSSFQILVILSHKLTLSPKAPRPTLSHGHHHSNE